MAYRIEQTGAELQGILDDAVLTKQGLEDEVTRAQAAEGGLQENIDSEAGERQSADALLAGNIGTEVARAQQAESDLGARVDANAAGVAAEVARAQEAEGQVWDTLNDEILTRQSQDAALQGNIEREAGLREAGDGQLQGEIYAISGKIPVEASDMNQLADKQYVQEAIEGTPTREEVAAIEAVIPAAASEDNKLVDTATFEAAIDGKQDTLTFDEEPTEGSENPVTSGGVASAVATLQGLYAELRDGKADKAATLAGYGIEDAYTKGAVDEMIGALSRNEVVVGALPQTGEEGVIYRVPGNGYYTDYMYYDGSFVELAQYSMEFDQTQVGYFTCDTAAGTAAKTVSAAGYTLAVGGNMRIKMANANTAANATLNINGAGAKALYYNGEQASASNSWEAGEVLTVYYDGTQYQAAVNGGGSGSFFRGNEVDVMAQEGFYAGYIITSTNQTSAYNGGTACRNIPIGGWSSCRIVGTTSAGAFNCLTDENGNVVARMQGTNITIDLTQYPTARFISVCTLSGLLELFVLTDTETPMETALSDYDATTMQYAKALQGEIALPFVSKTGGYYTRLGAFVARADSQFTDTLLIPPTATKAYYTGESYGAADGGILWLDKDHLLIGYFAGGTAAIVSHVEVPIPDGAVYYRASSYVAGAFLVEFDAPAHSLDDFEQITRNTEAIAEQKETLDKVVYGNFESFTESVETPPAQTSTAGVAATGIWGMVLKNTGFINLASVRFYSSSAKSSFVIAVGTADTDAKTYRIDASWTVPASVVAGENTVDVSSYGIVIPPQSLVVCTGPTHYIASPVAGVEKMVGTIGSTSAGSEGTYRSGFDMCMQIVYIGTMDGYSVVIPEQSLAIALRGNILYGKKYVAIGDSFTAPIGSDVIDDGPYAGQSKVYSYIIGNRNNMVVTNQGVSGSVLNGYIANSRYSQIPQDVDYVTIWYGINDAGHGISIGTVDDQPETISAETATTTCGGYNWMFKWLLTNRPFAHVGVIITDFCEASRREAIIACCQKWGIAYLDLYDPTVPMIRTRGTTRYTHDTSIAPLGYVEVCSEAKQLRNEVFSTNPSQTNMHPNNDCHQWQSNLIENFMRGL